MFPQHCLYISSSAHLIDDGPLLSYQGRLSSVSSFYTSSSGMMSLALYRQVVSQTSKHFRSSKKQATCEGCFACWCVSSFPFTLACSGQYTRRSFEWWMLTIHTYHAVWASYSTFCFLEASSLNLWGWWCVWSDCHCHCVLTASSSIVRLEVQTI